MGKPPPPRTKYENVSPYYDDLGRRICRGCHNPVVRSTKNPRKWPKYCSDKCSNWEKGQRYYARTNCRCGRLKDKWKYRCPDCAAHSSYLQRLKQYGLTIERATTIMDVQGWRCFCGAPVSWGSCHVDHDHACCPQNPSDTGSLPICGECVRGFLCPGCNVGLGSFKDDADRLRAAADYIDAWNHSRKVHLP